ncbi:MAG: glycosyltransferase family 2 protein, partial [Thermoleophilia bacterium]
MVVCTNGRPSYVAPLLETLKALGHPDIEIIVVQGPDGRDDVALAIPGVRWVHTDQRNIAAARNLGVRAARGDFVAFLDDDALPETYWLDELRTAIEGSEEVAGAGGPVFDHTGIRVQLYFNTISRTGVSRPILHSQDVCAMFSSPDSWEVPFAPGANCGFRRTALVAIGGFDEAFTWAFEEAELCLRLIDAGYAIAAAPGAWIHHKMAPSRTRNAGRIFTNWSEMLRGASFFAYRHGISEGRIVEDLGAFIASARANVEANITLGTLDGGARDAFEDALDVAITAGRELAAKPPQLRPPGWFDRKDLCYPATSLRRSRPPTTCVVAPTAGPYLATPSFRSVWNRARDLTARGHAVRLVVPGAGPSRVDREDGVWVHRVGGVPTCTLTKGEPLPAGIQDELNRLRTFCD